MKKIIYIFTTMILVLILSACTKDFEAFNKNPYQISDEDLQQDYNHIGAFYPPLLSSSLFGRTADRHQIQHNLTHEAFIRHLAPPTPFAGGRNNTTYHITWNTFWGHVYGEVMSPARLVQGRAEEDGYDVFAAWAKLLQIVSASRLTAYHGPIIYSDYGSSEQTVYYDSEQDLYNYLFADLDAVLAVFAANADYLGLSRFDETYKGNMGNWIRFINSWRLQLALRLSNVAPALAKTEGEKAINHSGGLILSNIQNMNVPLLGVLHHIARISFNWNDTRMSAAMESVLVGYEDGRIGQFFSPATDNTLYPDHPTIPYKGVRSGALLHDKDLRVPYSRVNSSFQTATQGTLLPASLVHFMLAEAALRGWSGTQSAGYHYEEGVRASFFQWNAPGIEKYLMDDTKIPIDYIDPRAEGDVNSFTNRIQVTVKWDGSASDEVKLERIMTQKWIAGFGNSVETWVDHRRTGYPKLPYNYKNDSGQTWGVIAADDFLKRMPFVPAERNNNPVAVADATQKLGGPDLISTRLWWDIPGPNF